MTITVAILATALAAGPFGTVTGHQYRQVHDGQTRHHVEHRIFDDVTGVFITRWRGPTGWVHTFRDYRERDGRFIEISYRRLDVDGARWHVYAKGRNNE
jgi:hypothetical protein